MLLASIALTSFTISTKNSDILQEKLISYFFCELGGHDPDQPCDRSQFEQENSPVISTLSYILLGLFPIGNLVYALNISELKEICKVEQLRAKFTGAGTLSTPANSYSSKKNY